MAGHLFKDGVVSQDGQTIPLDSLISELRVEMERTRGHGTKWACLAAALLMEREQRPMLTFAPPQPELPKPKRERDPDDSMIPSWVKDTPRCPATQKRSFPSKHAALASNARNGQRLRAYLCDDCHGWHCAKNGR